MALRPSSSARMTCQELEHFLYPVPRRRVRRAEERLDVERHLASAPTAPSGWTTRAAFQADAPAKRPTRPTPRAPASLRAGIQAGLRASSAAPQLRLAARSSAAAPWWWWPRRRRAGYVTSRPSARQRFLEDAALRHAQRLPLEVSRLPHEQVEAWFDGKLDHRVAVPALRHATLAGARLSNVHGPRRRLHRLRDAPRRTARRAAASGRVRLR